MSTPTNISEKTVVLISLLARLSSQAIQVVEESKRFEILHQRDFEGRVNRGNVRTDQVLTCLEERLMGEIRKSFAVWRCEFLCW